MNENVERILDVARWPNIEFPENLEVLNELADESYNVHTINGMLSATLMNHQIIEARCMHLLDDCHFFRALKAKAEYYHSKEYILQPNII